jgi:hypothetical protein
MLTDVTIIQDSRIHQVLSLIGQGGRPERIQQGIYVSRSFSIGNDIINPHDDYPNLGELSPYGVCDTIQQVLDLYDEYFSGSNKYCVGFTKVVKSEQSDMGGWRWHKWGDYIGDKNPQCEYIYDEDDTITEVFCFHIYLIK